MVRVIIYSSSQNLRFWIPKGNPIRWEYRRIRNSVKKKRLVLNVLKTAKIADLGKWGEITIELSEKGLRALRILSITDFRRIKKVNPKWNVEEIIDKLMPIVITQLLSD